MSERLNQDQIANLVEAAKSGQLPDAPAHRGKRRAPRMHTVDFSRPTKFNADHQRRIERAIDGFCHSASTRLSAELRTPVEMETINTVQLTWGAAQAQLPPSSVAMTVKVNPMGTHMLLTAEIASLLTAIEHLLGGTTDGAVPERRLSEIDWSLIHRMLDGFVAQFSPLWEDLAGITLESESIDLRSESSPIAQPSDPSLAVLIEMRMARQSGMMGLLVPWAAIDVVGDRLSGKQSHDEETDPVEAAAVASALSAANVTLRAEVAATQLSIHDVLTLAPGSLIRLGGRADRGATIYVEETPLRRAQPGRSGRHRAVKVAGDEVVHS